MNWDKLHVENRIRLHGSESIVEPKPNKVQDSIIRRVRQGNWSPLCPLCNSYMIKRIGPFSEFWGCSKFPRCRGIAKTNEKVSGRCRIIVALGINSKACERNPDGTCRTKTTYSTESERRFLAQASQALLN